MTITIQKGDALAYAVQLSGTIALQRPECQGNDSTILPTRYATFRIVP